MPDTFVRFRPPTDYAFECFERGTEWLASPETYNDPIDAMSLHTLDHDALERGARAAAEEFAATGEIDADATTRILESQEPMVELFLCLQRTICAESEQLDREQVRAMLDNGLRDPSALSQTAGELFRCAFNVCSFSESLDSNNMWAHYAQQHRGFAVEYAATDLLAPELHLLTLHPARYSQSAVDVTSLYTSDGDPERNFGLLLSAVLTKDPSWSAEREWRVVVPATPDAQSVGSHLLMPKPRRVVLGMRAERETIDRIVSLADGHGVPVCRALFVPGEGAVISPV